MTHVDKNADGHAVDQNLDQSRGRLPTYLLMEGLGLNVVHACNFLFFIF